MMLGVPWGITRFQDAPLFLLTQNPVSFPGRASAGKRHVPIDLGIQIPVSTSPPLLQHLSKAPHIDFLVNKPASSPHTFN